MCLGGRALWHTAMFIYHQGIIAPACMNCIQNSQRARSMDVVYDKIQFIYRVYGDVNERHAETSKVSVESTVQTHWGLFALKKQNIK